MDKTDFCFWHLDFIRGFHPDLIHRTWIKSIHKLCFSLRILNGHISTNTFREKCKQMYVVTKTGMHSRKQTGEHTDNTLKIKRQASTPTNSLEISSTYSPWCISVVIVNQEKSTNRGKSTFHSSITLVKNVSWSPSTSALCCWSGSELFD